MLPNLRYARAHERKVIRVFRAELGKCGACEGAAIPRQNRSDPSGGSTYLPLERACSDALENERVGADGGGVGLVWSGGGVENLEFYFYFSGQIFLFAHHLIKYNVNITLKV